MNNIYVGKWEEAKWKEIKLPYTSENLKFLLQQIMTPDSQYTHQDVAHWCTSYYLRGIENDAKDVAVNIAKDVSTQWDLFLSNEYSLEELQKLDFSTVKLPLEWFEKWIKDLN